MAEEFDILLSDLRNGVVAQTTVFATVVADEIDRLVKRGHFGMRDAPRFRREFSSEATPTPTTHINQLLLYVEGVSFFLHAIDRLSFRQHSEELRAAILDPIAISLADMLTEKLKKKNIPIPGDGILNTLQQLSLEFGEAPTLLGSNTSDENCALWFAARCIGHDAGYSKPAFVELIARRLEEGLVALDLTNRIKALEAVL